MPTTPFATAGPKAVGFEKTWQFVVDGATEDVGDFIENWDYMTELKFRSELMLDVGEILSSTHQGPSAKFAVVISAASSATRLRAPVLHVPMPPDCHEPLTLEVSLSSFDLGGKLDLLSNLVVLQPDPVNALGASLAGAIVWRDRWTVSLDGDASQFPTESTDLSQPPYQCPKAAWRLEVDIDDLDADAGQAIRLLLNQVHPAMQAELNNAQPSESSLLLKTMRWDVARQLISLALNTDEFVERSGSFEDGSLGWSLANLVSKYFPNESPTSLRAMLRSQPTDFEAQLQNSAGAFS